MIGGLTRRMRYDQWANGQLLASLKNHPPQPPLAIRMMNHIVAASWLWLARLEEQQAPYPVWPEWDVDECAGRLLALSDAWDLYLSKLNEDTLQGTLSYATTQGKKFESTRLDILEHLLLHGAYHRGQIASGLRHGGVEPPLTDFIHPTREGLLD